MSISATQPTHGIIVVVYAATDSAPGAVIERSLNGVTGFEEVGIIPAVVRQGDAFVDELPNDNITRFYRARHVWESGDPGEYTNVVAGEPVLINPNLDLNARPWPTEVPVNTAINIDDDGNVSLFVDGSFRSKSIEYAFVTASADFTGSLTLPDIEANGIVYNFTASTDPTESAFITPTNPDGLLGITEQELNIQLLPGEIIRTGVRFYTEEDGEGRLLATHYEVARYIDPDIDAVKLEPDFIVSLDYFNSGSNDDAFVKVILDVIDPAETLDRIEYFFSEGPIGELPDIDEYTLTWTQETSGPLSGSYTQDVKLNEKHFGVLAFAGYWEDADSTERVFTKILYLDVGDDANIVNINVSYDDNGDVALIQVKGDADTQELRAQEFRDGDWTTVLDPDPAFTDNTKFSDTRRGSFSVDTAEEEQRYFRVFGRNNKDLDGPKEEFFINSKLDIVVPPVGPPFITIDYVAPTEAQGGEIGFDFRSIVVAFELTGSGVVESVRVINNSIGIPVENLDSSVLTTDANWTQVGTNAYQWVITDNSLNPIDFPIPYGSDVGITLQAFADISGSEFLGEARIVFRDDTTFDGLVFVSGSQQFNSSVLGVGTGLTLTSNSPVTMSVDANTLPTTPVTRGGTGLESVEIGALLIGSGSTDPLGILSHPDSGGSIRVLQASGSITTRQLFWAEPPVAGVAAVGEGNGIEISGTGTNPVVNARLYKEGDTLSPPADTAVLDFYTIEGNSSIGIPLGTGARQAAAGDHTHTFAEITDKPANLVSSSAQVTELLDTGSTKFTEGVDKRLDAKALFSASAQVDINSTTGTLNVDKGGTGLSSITLGSLLVGSGSSIGEISHPDSGGTVKVLQASGSITTRELFWADPPAAGLTNITEGDGILVTGTGGTRNVAAAIYASGQTLTPPADTGELKFVDIEGKQRIGVSLGIGAREAAAGDHTHTFAEITDKPAGLVSGSSQIAINDTTGTLNVNKGGTGQTSYTNGQLLIGNSTGNTLTKATLTAGTGITVTNGGGSITIASTATGTVTSVGSGTGLTGGPITTSGTLALTGQALALHNLATNGVIARTGAGTVAGRTITAGTGISISNGNGVSGNPTITALNNGTVTSIATNNGITGGTITTSGTVGLTGQALALHNLSTSGLIARTGTNTVAGRTITAGTGISISNGNGVSGNPTITATNNGTVTSVGSGNGMNFTTITGTGNVTLGTPSTLTATSTNSVTSNSHTHALDGNIGRVFVQGTNPSGSPARAGDITFVI